MAERLFCKQAVGGSIPSVGSISQTMDLNTFKTDKKKEQEGVRVPFDDATLIIARLNNPNHVADFKARQRVYRGAKVPDDVNQKIYIESLAATVLLGWENVTLGGTPLPYTKENAVMALSIPDFADFVVMRAGEMELFREEQQREAVESLEKN